MICTSTWSWPTEIKNRLRRSLNKGAQSSRLRKFRSVITLAYWGMISNLSAKLSAIPCPESFWTFCLHDLVLYLVWPVYKQGDTQSRKPIWLILRHCETSRLNGKINIALTGQVIKHILSNASNSDSHIATGRKITLIKDQFQKCPSHDGHCGMSTMFTLHFPVSKSTD